MVLKGNVDNILKQILQKICNDYNYHIKALEVMSDHIHIFVEVPQTVASCDVDRTLKSISAIELFKAYPQLKKFYASKEESLIKRIKINRIKVLNSRIKIA